MSNIPSQNPYQQPATFAVPQAQMQQHKDQSLAIISLVTGILSPTLGCWFCIFIPLSLVALITGLLAMQKVANGTGGGYGMALTGVILGGGTLLLGGGGLAFVYFYFQNEMN